MELEMKPRGIAIPPAAAAADDFLLTRNLSGTFSSGSVPIRAPLTLDDDDDDGSGYSRGFDSGIEDGFGYVSGDVEDEIELEDVSRVHRVVEEETGDGSGESVIDIPFGVDVVEETSVNYSSFEEESERSDEVEGVTESEEASDSDSVSVKAKVVIPRAVLSLDDDDDDELLGSDDGEARIEDRTLQFGDVGMVVDEPQQCSDSVMGGEFVSTEEVVRMSYLDNLNSSLMMPFGNAYAWSPGGDNFTEEPEQLIERGVVQRTISKEDGDGSIHEFNALMKPGDVQDDAGELGEMGMTDKPEYSGSVSSEEGKNVDVDRGVDETFSKLIEEGVGEESISKEHNNDDSICEAGEESSGLGSKESGVEDTGTKIGEAKGHCENDCGGAVSEVDKLECEREPETGMSSEGFTLTPIVDSVMPRNLETDGGIDVVSGCCSTGRQSEQEYEETGLLSVKDAERSMSEDSSVAAYDKSENERRMAQLIHNQTCLELDEYEGTGDDTRERLSESTFQKCLEELSSDHSVQLISKKVKERVAKTELLKAKIQSITGGIDLCSEDSAVTEVESNTSMSDGEDQTSDYVSDETKMMLLPEQEFPADLDFSVNILVIGKTGVGKSATVNSIFGETKSPVGAFGVTTKRASYVVGNIGGVMVRILDTPGLMSSASEERFNQEVLMSIKQSMRKFPVDVVLYIDRLDEIPDVYLLRTITNSLGSSIWRNSIVVLTHSASIVPDSSSYIAQRSSLMRQSIRQAAPELDQRKMPEIILAENNICGNKTTSPDWRLNLLISCCSVKIGSKSIKEKAATFGSITLLCSLWSVLLPGHVSHSDDYFKEKTRHLLDSTLLTDEQSLEQNIVQEQEDEERRKRGSVVDGRVRRRSGRLGFQATKRLGIYLDLQTGFSIGSLVVCRKEEEEEGRKMVVKMRGSMSVLCLVPMLMMSVFTSCRNNV